jgi:hypothetical protein
VKHRHTVRRTYTIRALSDRRIDINTKDSNINLFVSLARLPVRSTTCLRSSQTVERSRGSIIRLQLDCSRTVFASRVFRNAAPLVWNCLPHHITDDLSTPPFFVATYRLIFSLNLDCRGQSATAIHQFILIHISVSSTA